MQRIDAVYHVRGESEFVDDMPPPAEILYAAVFASPVARGKILSIFCYFRERKIVRNSTGDGETDWRSTKIIHETN
ncbi:hypothetical protein NIES2098_62860 [Calothrix sp. NIES-2098]|nr:hypothetical protein NIES2098_62860 [Calothrix sp. NIES-2098]